MKRHRPLSTRLNSAMQVERSTAASAQVANVRQTSIAQLTRPVSLMFATRGVSVVTPSRREGVLESGDSFAIEPCAGTEVCETGSCVPRVCQAGTDVRCEAGLRVVCNSIGSGWIQLPCPETHVCKEGECLLVHPPVLILVDTSFSMNQLVESDQMAGGCNAEQGSCPSWTWPDCDDVEAPLTRLGVVKKIISELAEAGEENGLRLALQRFPQRPGIIGGCNEGYYKALDTMTGDDDAHDTTNASWFDENMEDAIIVPFDVDGSSSRADITAW